jgi:hypothetical protein
MPVVRLVLVTLALLLVNAVVSTGDFVEAPATALPSAIGIELVALVALLALATWRRPRAPAWLLWPLAALLLAVGVVRALDTAIPWFFSRSFNLMVDARFVPVVWEFLSSSTPTRDLLLLAIGAVVAVAATVALLRYALGAIARALAAHDWRPFAAAAAVMLVGWLVVPKAPSADERRPLVSADAAAVIGRQAEFVLNAQGLRRDYLTRIRRAEAARLPRRDLARLEHRNVLLIFVESYGAVTFTNPGFAARIDPVRARMGARLRAAGFQVASDMIRSPITGGGSWLAHTTMMTGVLIDDQPSFDVLLTTRLHAIAQDFSAAGYRTVALMPRINEGWPEGRLFGFDQVVIGSEMGYSGPRYTWESMPDQYALDWLGRHVLADARQPLFAKIVLASSHTPFDRVPPVIDDWNALGDGSIYGTVPVRHLPVRGGLIFEHDEGYLACLEYALDSLSRFIAERISDDTLVIVLGDHQPPLTTARATRDRSVPISVISRDPALIAPFLARGYAEGLRPGRMVATSGMEDFLEGFVADFSTATSAQAPQ